MQEQLNISVAKAKAAETSRLEAAEQSMHQQQQKEQLIAACQPLLELVSLLNTPPVLYMTAASTLFNSQ